MTNTQLQSQKRLTVGLMAVGFGIGYFISEYLPTIALTPALSVTQTNFLEALFGASQLVSLLLLAFVAQRLRPLQPIKALALLLPIAALFGWNVDSAGFIGERILAGIAAGSLSILASTILRQARDNTESGKHMAHVWIFHTLGFATGSILPVLGLNALGETGRMLTNLFIGLIVTGFALRLPKMGRLQGSHETLRATRPLVVLFIVSFLSVGGYVAFFQLTSKVFVPEMTGSQTLFWFLTALVHLVAGMISTAVNRFPFTRVRESTGFCLTLLMMALAYLLPLVAPRENAISVLLLLVANLLVLIGNIFAESYWSILIGRAAGKNNQVTILSLGLAVAAASRTLWMLLLGVTIGNGFHPEQALLLAFGLGAIAALLTHLFRDNFPSQNV